MSHSGLEVFDKTLQATNIWLDEIMADIGPDRRVAWHVLGAVLRAVRDKVPADVAAHLGAQLPLLVRGAYYQNYVPRAEPARGRHEDDFLAAVRQGLDGSRPVDLRDAVSSVFTVLSAHLPRGQCTKVRSALPQALRALWNLDDATVASVEERAAAGRSAQNAGKAAAHRRRETSPGSQC